MRGATRMLAHPMLICPACGKENEDVASECKRCRAPLREGAAGAGLTVGARSGVAPETPPPAALAPPGLAQSSGRARIGEGIPSAAPSGAAPARRPPPAPPRVPPPEWVLAAALPAGKACPKCGALNPPAAKFCFECGTPFARKAAPAAPRPPSIEVAAELPAETFVDATMESSPVAIAEAVPAESVAEPIPEEQPPPFAAELVLQNGGAEGTQFALGHLENTLRPPAAPTRLAEEPLIAPPP